MRLGGAGRLGGLCDSRAPRVLLPPQHQSGVLYLWALRSHRIYDFLFHRLIKKKMYRLDGHSDFLSFRICFFLIERACN